MLLKITHNKTINKEKYNLNMINSLWCWSVTLLMFTNLQDSRDWKFGACQKWEHVRLAVWVILGIFWSFSRKAHTYYPTYDIGAYFSDWTLATLCWIIFMKTFYNVISSIICCSKEARASIILDWLNESVCLEKLWKTSELYRFK